MNEVDYCNLLEFLSICALEFYQPLVDPHPGCGSNMLVTYCCPQVVPLPIQRVNCVAHSVLRWMLRLKEIALLSRATA